MPGLHAIKTNLNYPMALRVMVHTTNAESLKLFRPILQQTDLLQTAFSENLEQAMDAWQEGKYDLLLVTCDDPAEIDAAAETLHQVSTGLVLASSNEIMASRAYRLRAFDFLELPLTTELLARKILQWKDSILHTPQNLELINQRYHGERYLVKEKENLYWFKLEQVVYFEASKNYVKVYLQDAVRIFYSTLIEVERKVPTQYFFRANRRHLVNLDHVQQISISDQDLLVFSMANQTAITLSQRQSVIFRNTRAL